MKDHQARFSIRRMARVLGVSVSGYYAWRRRPPSQREMANRQLVTHIRASHQRSRATYGSPRIHAELRAQGLSCGRHRVARLMRQQGIAAKQPRRYRHTTRRDLRHPVAANLMRHREFPQAPNQQWVSDITYIPTGDGWLYLASIMDRFSRRIVGWAMGPRQTQALTQEALQMAIDQRCPPTETLHYSDQGSQYTAAVYRRQLGRHQFEVSMSRAGNCYDNAHMESFFATLKAELTHHRCYRTRDEARADVFNYIETFYNPYRRHSALGYLSPRDFEVAWAAQIS